MTVVEYLQSIMSKELLGKFPDNSAFDFDYTQSSIWSPLIQRQNGRGLDMEELSKSLSSSSSFSPSVLQRKLEYNEEEDCDEMAENEISSKCITSSVSIKKLTAVFKRKIGVNVFDSFRIYRDAKMKKKSNRKGLVFSPGGAVKSPNIRKVCSNLLGFFGLSIVLIIDNRVMCQLLDSSFVGVKIFYIYYCPQSVLKRVIIHLSVSSVKRKCFSVRSKLGK